MRVGSACLRPVWARARHCARTWLHDAGRPGYFIMARSAMLFYRARVSPCAGPCAAFARGAGAGGSACLRGCRRGTGGHAGRFGWDAGRPGYSIGAERLALFRGRVCVRPKLFFPSGKARVLRGAGYADLPKRSIFFSAADYDGTQGFPLDGAAVGFVTLSPPSPRSSRGRPRTPATSQPLTAREV